MRPLPTLLPLALLVLGLSACGDETLRSVDQPAPPEDPPQTEEEPPPEDEPPPEEPPPEEPPEEAPPPPPDSGDSCTDDSDCGSDSRCTYGVCTGAGVLQVALSFDVDSDFDLHLLTPDYTEIYFGNSSAAGGVLDVDECVTSCGGGIHVENIFFPDVAQSGLYGVWVVNYDGRSAGGFEIDVTGAANISFSGYLSDWYGESSELFFFTVP